MAMFYGMINIAAENTLIIYANNMRKDQPDTKIKRKYFLLRIAQDLVTPLVTQQYKVSTLPRNIKRAIFMCGFVSDSEENTCRTLETTRRYQESKGTVMYAAGVEI
jgi:hypothetical protein